MTHSTSPSRTTMRRHVTAAGGYYSRQRGCWVLPGSTHNCSPCSVEPFIGSLEAAFEASDDHAASAARVQGFGEAEAVYLRGMR